MNRMKGCGLNLSGSYSLMLALANPVTNLRVHKMRGVSLIAEGLLASQAGMHS
jgi:hypothetical protein